MQKNFRITPDNREEVMKSLGAFLRASDVELAISVKEYKKKRSEGQSRRLHKLIRLCAEESGYSVTEMKLTFKGELLTPSDIIEIKEYRIPDYKSTADMNIAELNSFMEGVENLAALWYNIVLPAEAF